MIEHKNGSILKNQTKIPLVEIGFFLDHYTGCQSHLQEYIQPIFRDLESNENWLFLMVEKSRFLIFDKQPGVYKVKDINSFLNDLVKYLILLMIKLRKQDRTTNILWSDEKLFFTILLGLAANLDF